MTDRRKGKALVDPAALLRDLLRDLEASTRALEAANGLGERLAADCAQLLAENADQAAELLRLRRAIGLAVVFFAHSDWIAAGHVLLVARGDVTCACAALLEADVPFELARSSISASVRAARPSSERRH